MNKEKKLLFSVNFFYQLLTKSDKLFDQLKSIFFDRILFRLNFNCYLNLIFFKPFGVKFK